jgi:hypothetical protein
MTDANPKLTEIFVALELIHFDLIKNEDDFIKSWERYKKKSEKVIITNHEDAQFYADCEKFTKLILKTRKDHQELDKKWDQLRLSKKKLEMAGNKK